ncbi:hypothetical protein B7486_39800 [cyanobacterium TDX16]|nr:hypothetical protein B7486_39800 [cyanobacterium TDX16]
MSSRIYIDDIDRVSFEGKNTSFIEEKILERGNRAIITGAGFAFLGGLFAQLPGAITGAVIGIIFGLFASRSNVRPNE